MSSTTPAALNGAVPRGAAYAGAPDDYAADHIKSRIEVDEDRGITVFSPETYSQGGLLRVAQDRITRPGTIAEPTSDAAAKGARKPDPAAKGVQIWHEVHGTGPQKIVLIMGLNNSGFGWLGQVEHFARDPRYSVLVLDNRGYGNSETPTVMNDYKTSEMAKDVLEVCDRLGWREKRQLHVTGVSMGGMISLEVARQAPERIASLSLLSTTSGQARGQKSLVTGLPPTAAVKMITRLLGGKWLGMDSDEYRVHRVAETLFPKAWLDEKDDKDPKGRTRRENMHELFLWRFHFVRRQHPTGALGQIRAASTHHIPNAVLTGIDSSIPSILIATGDDDNLVKPGNSHHLAKWLPSAKLVEMKGVGHAIQLQVTERLNELLEENYGKGWEKTKGERGAEDGAGEDLPASKLGTKAHWDQVYQREVTNFKEDGDRGEIWFGKESADVMLDYLLEHYPSASDANPGPRIMDMGTGNGHLLFSLCGVPAEDEDSDDEDAEERRTSFRAITKPERLMGVDYSPASIDLCKSIAAAQEDEAAAGVRWETADVLDAAQVSSLGHGEWDILLDKGTLDAIALSSPSDLTKYISHLPLLLSTGGLLLVVTCNWTPEELIARVESGSKGGLKHKETLPPRKVFRFGGKEGSTTRCVAFVKTA